MLATRDQLKLAIGTYPNGGLALGQKECEVMFDGEPPPRCGKRFFSVHRGGRENQARHSLDELYAVFVTITLRVNEPFDALGTNLIEKAQQGMDDLVDSVRDIVHMNYTLMAAANATILAVATAGNVPLVYGFSEPLMFQGDDAPRIVGPDWFKAQVETTQAPIGIAQTLRFGQARRLQPLTIMQ